MLETLRCPGCSTHYLLSPARIRPGLGRAKCFRCSTIFSIEAEVGRILAQAAPAAAIPAPAALLEEPPALTLDDLQGIQDDLLEPAAGGLADLSLAFPPEPEDAGADLILAEPPEDTLTEEETGFLFSSGPTAPLDLDGSALRLAAQEPPSAEPARDSAAGEAGNAPAGEAGNAPAGEAGNAAATAPLDLKASGFRMPEKSAPPAPPEFTPGSHFASAKDAIQKLMGQAPPAPAPHPRLGGRGTMDMEATLDALESTLSGGAHPAAPETPEPEAPPAPHLPESTPGTASTVKLSTEEIRAAMAAAQASTPAEPALPQPPAPAPPPPAPAAQHPDLLKIQLETEVCNNITVDQMTAWIEQGRVQEYHMVARQFSENWIEAVKVPALRPVFDRVRRSRPPQAEPTAAPAPEPPAPKRGLFSGLFGRN